MRARASALCVAVTAFLAASCAASLHEAAKGSSGGRCDAADAEQERVWNAATRAQVQSTLARLGPAYATRTARDTVARMDAAGAAWTKDRTVDCKALGPELACFDAALSTERAAVKVLLASDLSSLPRSFDVVDTVSMAVERCRHPEAVAAFSQDAPSNPLGTATTLRAAADAAVLAGKPAEACELAEQALSHVERVLGPDSRETLDYELWVARIERANGEHAQAAQRYARAIAKAERALGPQDGLLAGARLSLGQTHAALGSFKDAEREERLGLQVAERAFGPEHPASGDAHHALGVLFYEQQEHAEALVEGESALSIRRAAFGDVSLPVAESFFLVGNALSALGKPDAALEAYTGALTVRVRLLGAQHPEVGETHLAIGRTLEALGRHSEALVELQRALSIEEDAIGAKIPDLAAELLKESLGPEHPAVAAEQGRIASILVEQGKFDDATDTYREVLRLDENALGKEHPTTGSDHRHLGMALAALGQCHAKEARSELTVALGIYQKASPVDEVAVQELREALTKLGSKTPEVERPPKK
jgi:tetratricopeptide (TPR) repeat protein